MKAAELRQSILQAAVQGKLVPQNSHDEPASELLRRIQQEKIRLVKEGKLKKEKSMPPIITDEIPYDLPEGWIWCRLGELIYYSDAGKSPACKNSPAKTNEIGVIKTTAIQREKFLSHENKVLPANFQFDSRMLIQAGDILITRAGPKNRTGIACLVDKCDSALILSDKTVRLNCDGEFVYKPYIVAAINSLPIRNLLIEKMTGMAESQVNISQSNIAVILFPVPPLIEQRRIMTKVNELMVLCDALEAEEKKLDTLETRFTEYLPKTILQAAVQGKLVPQDPHDEPASELLKRIQQEKAQLFKEGKLKKEKPLPPISEDEIPYELPEGWEWTRISDIAIINPRNSLPDDTEVSFLPMNLISQDYFGEHRQETRIWSQVKSGFTHFAENDVLIAKITPCFQNGKSCIAHKLKSGYGAGTTELHVLRPFGISPQYLLMFLKSPDFLETCAHNMTGTAGQQRVPTDYIKKYIFPLPPLMEQQRIITKVEELMTLCEELKSAYAIPVKFKQVETEIIPFPTAQKESKTLLAARGDVGQLSNEAMQAIDDLFAEDEE